MPRASIIACIECYKGKPGAVGYALREAAERAK